MKFSYLIIFLILFSCSIYSQWFIQASGTTNGINSAIFYDEMTGWVCGAGGLVLKTTNGGDNWISIQTNTNDDLFSIFFINNSTGWASGESGKILKTTNGGQNWFFQTSGINYTIWSISFANENSGIATAWSVGLQPSSSNLLRTTNGGQNWNKLFTTNLARLNYVVYSGILTGWAVGVLKIFKTTDGWNSWEQQLLDTNNYRSAFFLNSNTGWVVGWNHNYNLVGIIKKTTNGGGSFTQQGNEIARFLKSVYFNNINTGWVVGDTSIVYKTTNSGCNWILKSVPVQQRLLNCIYFANENTGWIVGSQGTILKTISGGEIGIKEISTITPENSVLYQNYPNPFNPSTKIKFDLPKSNLTLSGAKGLLVRLVIYDILGKEIAVLVNEQLKPGSYEAEWNASNYPSGVYYYKLISGDYTDSKKMVLVK